MIVLYCDEARANTSLANKQSAAHIEDSMRVGCRWHGCMLDNFSSIEIVSLTIFY